MAFLQIELLQYWFQGTAESFARSLIDVQFGEVRIISRRAFKMLQRSPFSLLPVKNQK